mgnify:CR=1 FL=1
MPTFKEFLGSKPKQPKQETNLPRRRYGTSPEDVAAEKAEVEERRVKAVEEAKKKDAARAEEIKKAKQKFQSDKYGEKPKLESRLLHIPTEIAELEQGLAKMKGLEMRRILDKEYELNSAMTPDSIDPNKRHEYEEFVRALDISREAVQQQKANLGARIDEYQKKISGLEQEKREAEQRIQRGY